MKKSGLQKQITSIFSGIGEKKTASTGLAANTSETAAEANRLPADNSHAAATTSSQELFHATAPAAAPTARPVRPSPVCRQTLSTAVRPSAPGLAERFKKTVLGGASSNPRQKKTALLAGILVVVFGVVMFLSLGGIGGSAKAKAAPAKTSSSATVQSQKPVWKTPEALPEKLRDPMKPAGLPQAETAESGEESAGLPGDFVVKGIVFSKNKPSALINNEIVKEGEMLNGITIKRIDKGEVEFERDGKRWTQQVQR